MKNDIIGMYNVWQQKEVWEVESAFLFLQSNQKMDVIFQPIGKRNTDAINLELFVHKTVRQIIQQT